MTPRDAAEEITQLTEGWDDPADWPVFGDPDPAHTHLRLRDDSLACGAGHVPAGKVRSRPCCRLNPAAVTCPDCLNHSDVTS